MPTHSGSHSGWGNARASARSARNGAHSRVTTTTASTTHFDIIDAISSATPSRRLSKRLSFSAFVSYARTVRAILRNLWRSRLRTSLTLLGVAAGTSVLVSLLSITAGLKGQMQALLVNQRLDVAVQARGAPSPVRSRISAADYEALRRVPGVREVAALVVGTYQTPWNPFFVLFGVSGVETLSAQLRLVEGRMFQPGERALLLGDLAARELGYRVGNKIMLASDEIFSIVGIYSLGVGIGDGGAVLDLPDARRLLQQGDAVNLAFVRAAGAVDRVLAEIRRAFPHLTATRTGELIGEVRILGTLDLFAWAVTAIALAACCVGVMNTFLMAVTQRTREIGILLAVGWSRVMVFRLILGEALVIALGGALVGNALGLVALRALALSRASGLGWLPRGIPPEILWGSIVLVVVAGAVSALYPALRAARLHPADALRWE